MTTSETAAKKDIQKLQRAIVNGLEDVKALNIVVFNTEHLSPLFERVIVASGSSNRQTKALSASVRDAVREAGFAKPRIEGEENGEWIIVDCGAAVAHIMQPTIREYYRLEDIWGDKPVRLKHGADKPAATTVKAAAGKTVRKTAAAPSNSAAIEPTPKAKPARKSAAKSVVATKPAATDKPAVKKPAAKKPVSRTSSAAAPKAPAKKATPRKSSAASSAKVATSPALKPALKAPAKKTAGATASRARKTS